MTKSAGSHLSYPLFITSNGNSFGINILNLNYIHFLPAGGEIQRRHYWAVFRASSHRFVQVQKNGYRPSGEPNKLLWYSGTSVYVEFGLYVLLFRFTYRDL